MPVPGREEVNGVADGSVVIDTTIDTNGIDKGIRKASAKMLKMNQSIHKTQDEIKRIKSEMEDLKNTEVPTEEFSKLSAKVKTAENNFNSLISRREALESEGYSLGDKEWNALNRQVENARIKLQGYKSELDAVEQKSISGAATAKYAQLENQLAKNNQTLQVQARRYEELAAAESRASESGNKVSNGIKRIEAASRTGFKNMLSGAKKSGSGFNNLSQKVKQFGSRLSNVLKSVFIFTVLNKAFTALKERMGTLVSANAQLSGSLAQIKGNLNTAFQSIFSAALPALNALFSALVKVTSAIAAFISGIFGKSVKASQAAAQAADKQASSIGGVGKAASKASKQLMSFDDAQILSSNDSDSDAGGGYSASEGITPAYGDIDTSFADKWVQQIEDAWANADFTDVGMTVGEKINAALNAIPWDGIKKTFNRIASSIATFLNGFLAGTDWTLVGNTIAEGLNTAFGFLHTFVTTFNWSSLGTALANTINGFIQRTDFKQIAQTISGAINGLLATIVSFITTTDWAEIGRSIVQLIVNIDWGQLLIQLGQGLMGLVVGAFELLFGIVGELTASVADFFRNIGLDGIAGFFEGIANNLATAAQWIKDKFNEYIVQPVKDFFGIHSPSTLFASFGQFLIEGLKNGIIAKIAAIPGIFKEKFTQAWNMVKSIFSISNISSFFGTVISKIKGLFQNVGSAIGSAVGKTFASGVNTIFSTIESIVNGFINMINGAIGIINKVPGVKLSKLSTVSLPRLATGTVVPANYGEFAAILGDNKREPEVVSPVSTMKQAFKEALSEMGDTGSKNINLTVNLDGQTVYKTVVKYNDRNTKITGKNALAY